MRFFEEIKKEDNNTTEKQTVEDSKEYQELLKKLEKDGIVKKDFIEENKCSI